MRILGIETSCDETAASVIEGSSKDKNVKLLANVVASSLALHAKTGGIIPEVAAREQLRYILPAVEQVLKKSNLYPLSSKFSLRSSIINRPGIDAIAVTIGPGLIGSLLVGVETAKALAFAWAKPIVPVNHLIGHIYANFVGEMSNVKTQISNRKPEFPAVALVVSGGHTDLVLMKDHGNITWLGGTRDDAAGEAFDKIGRLLGLPYPGGHAIAAAAAKFQISNFKFQMFPRPMINEAGLDFSFSGLKTAVLRELKKREELTDEDKQRLAAEAQAAIVDVLVAKTLRAAQKFKIKSILLSGGVAANQRLREEFELNAKRYKLNAEIFAPKKFLCTDNAAMIAAAAFYHYRPVPWQEVWAKPELYFA